MNAVSVKECIVGAILLLLISDSNGAVSRTSGHMEKFDKNDLDWHRILEDIRKIPLIGAGTAKGLEDLAWTLNKIDELTNGALSRIAGGYPPCMIDVEGVHCKGKAKDGGVMGIVHDLVNHTGLPDIAKKVIIEFIDAAFFPIFNAIVGVPVSEGKTKTA